MIERIYMACKEKSEKAEHSGPFGTAAQAEAHMFRLGWSWIVVYTNTKDASGRVTEVQTRFYQPSIPRTTNDVATTWSNNTLRQLATPDVKPLNEEETTFFAQYERQMNGKS